MELYDIVNEIIFSKRNKNKNLIKSLWDLQIIVIKKLQPVIPWDLKDYNGQT
jgi:hypothetical protein